MSFLAVVMVLGAHARPFTVVAYNVENLFDLDGVAAYEEYQPAHYTPAHALTKLQNIARVLARFESGRGPDVVLLCELEADQTPGPAAPDYAALLAPYARTPLAALLTPAPSPAVADLPAEALLLKALADAGMTGYRVVIGEPVTAGSAERRQAITCAVLTRFPVTRARSHPTLNARAILEVELDVDGAPLHVFANHWKSGAGDPETEPTRVENARTLRARLDELLRADPNADIIIGGDLNSQYNQKRRYPKMKLTGINDVQGNELAIRGKQRDLYNLWYELPAPERGSDTYQGEWGTLMHLIVSRGLYDFRGVQYVDNSFGVAKFPGLNLDASGLPLRWSQAGPAGMGFSDHFPIFAKFITVPDGRADRYLALAKPAEEVSGEPLTVKIDYAGFDLKAVALTADRVPAGVSIRSDEFAGKVFRVEGRVVPGSRLGVEFRGETYDVWSFDAALRERLRAEHPAGAVLKFYGELGAFRDRWQFVIRDPSWVK
jgi:endonuclease/exonuclease/phosphatase family metal-dependent hydrolase